MSGSPGVTQGSEQAREGSRWREGWGQGLEGPGCGPAPVRPSPWLPQPQDPPHTWCSSAGWHQVPHKLLPNRTVAGPLRPQSPSRETGRRRAGGQVGRWAGPDKVSWRAQRPSQRPSWGGGPLLRQPASPLSVSVGTGIRLRGQEEGCGLTSTGGPHHTPSDPTRAAGMGPASSHGHHRGQ